MNLDSKHILAIADSLKTLRVEFEGIRFFSGQGVLTPNGETNPSEKNKNYKPSKSKNQNQNERNTDRKNKQPAGNKRYSKCGYWWSLEHLESLTTFVLA